MAEQSRNSWINKDEPTIDVSSMGIFKDDFEDILAERRLESDIKYALKARKDIPRYKYRTERSPQQLKEDVFNSDRVKYAIEKVASEAGVSTDKVQEEAKDILDELGHNLDLKSVRFFAFFLIKVFKRLFNRVYVNEEGVQQLRKLVQEYPVILMPTHRSYMDFLLVSYIFYHYDLPLPVIAAAMDFSGMKFMGSLLRNCGAFYIRRSFGTDILYWAIFTEYVQTQLRNGDAPVEFFVEGTRSRTAKSYQPRVGMLSSGLESYFKAELPDIMIVPISISYDRILEESLYAFELLGIPKPKESTSAMFKARSILNEDFGSVHFHICDAISIRDFSVGHIDRIKHALEPRYINNLLKDEQEITRELAYNIVRQQQKHMVISPWAIMAAVIMQSSEGITVEQLVKETDWLKRQTGNLGGYVDWPGNAAAEAVVRHNLGLHTNIVDVSDDNIIRLKLITPVHVKQLVHDDIMLNAATNVMLSTYRNHLLHVFVRVGMIALAVNGCCEDIMTKDELFQRYQYLQKLFSKEFVFEDKATTKDFEHALLNLSHSGGLTIEGDTILVKRSINKHTTFLSQMFEPFLLCYWVLCQHLLTVPGAAHGRSLPKKQKDLAKDAQKLSIRLVQENIVKHYEVLNLDMIGNGLNALTDMGAMYRDKRIDEVWLSPNHVHVSRVAEEIGHYVEVPHISIKKLMKAKPVVISAKI